MDELLTTLLVVGLVVLIVYTLMKKKKSAPPTIQPPGGIVISESGEQQLDEYYHHAIEQLPIEQEILDSHDEYTQNLDVAQGPSHLTERDDNNDLVPFVGLRRPDYSSIVMDGTARQENSTDASNYTQYRQLSWG
jgi:xanthosine utilization system XapX-like protein